MKHVAQFIHSFNIGGSEVLAANLARGLTRHGFSASVWAMAPDGALDQQLRSQGVRTASFDCAAGVSPVTVGRIALRLRRERVDAVVTHHFRQLFHVAPAALLAGTRLLHVEHDYHFYQDAPQYLPALRRLLRLASGFIVVSSQLADDFRQGLGTCTRCIPIANGVDTELFRRCDQVRSAMRAAYGFEEQHLVIGACSRLEPVKRIELLLAGFSHYLSSNPAARLVVVGGGSQEHYLSQEAHRLGLAGKVVFAGSRGNISEFLNMFDVFALTSHNEGLPLAVLEAMASELPVVSTNVGSVGSVIGAGTGILLEHATPEELSCAFAVLEDAAFRESWGRAARRIVESRHSQETMVQAYHDTLVRAERAPLGCLLDSIRTVS